MPSNKTTGKIEMFDEEFEASVFDDTSTLTQPCYEQLHATIISLIRYFLSEFQDENKFRQLNVLDCGAGTGKEAIGIARSIPDVETVVAIDNSSAMLGLLESKIKETKLPPPRGDRTLDEIIRPRRFDIVTPGVNGESLKALIEDPKDEREYEVVVTVFTLHHFDLEQKRRFYEACYDALCEGGMLINGDLFKFHSDLLSRWAQSMEEDWLEHHFEHPPFELREFLSELLGKGTGDLKSKWLKHLKNENIPLAIEEEIKMLDDIGFNEIGCVYRYFQAGIISCIK